MPRANGFAPPLATDRCLFDGFPVDLAVTVKDPDDLDAIVGCAIEYQVLSRDQMPDAGCDVVSRYPGIGVPCKLLPACFDRIQYPIGSKRVVARDVNPDADQVLIGPVGADDL